MTTSRISTKVNKKRKKVSEVLDGFVDRVLLSTESRKSEDVPVRAASTIRGGVQSAPEAGTVHGSVVSPPKGPESPPRAAAAPAFVDLTGPLVVLAVFWPFAILNAMSRVGRRA